MEVISWFSCGASSAVATKIALNTYDKVDIVYIDTGSEHIDNKRFLKDCEKWFNKEITIIKSDRYNNHYDVIKKTKYINGAYGASCTKRLKTEIRDKYLSNNKYDRQIFGFDYSKQEVNRFVRLTEQYPNFNAEAPLIYNRINKEKCLAMLTESGVELPIMYKLGYKHNNCIGCVKGGSGYWNKIRYDFPDVFRQISELETEIGHTCIKGRPLSTLPILPINNDYEEPRCDIFCELEYEALISPKTNNIMGLEGYLQELIGRPE